MKRISMLMLLAAAIYALTGCMATDYPCITDTENPDYAQCAATECTPDEDPRGGTCPLHNTRGWAHIIEDTQSATDLDNDGWTSQFIPFVSQDTAGNQMIISIAQSVEIPEEDWVFHSDVYAQAGQEKGFDPYAYAIYTNSTYTVSALPGAERPGDTGDITGSCLLGPEYDEFAYDYQFGTSCMIADADLTSLQAYYERLQEAGRREGEGYGLSFEDRLALLQKAEVGPNGLAWTFDANEVEVTVSQGPITKTLDLSVFHGRTFTLDPNRKGIVGNVLAQEWGISSHDFLWAAEQFNDFNRKGMINAQIKIDDITFNMQFAIPALFDPYVAASTLDKSQRGATTATGGSRQR